MSTMSQPTVWAAAFGALCPRCRAKTLYAGVLRFAANCAACGLDFHSFNVGDGPAAFLTLGIGAIVVAAAITVELAFSPPVWLHLALWPPVTLAAVMASLRWAKAALLALEYRNAAREGRLVDRER